MTTLKAQKAAEVLANRKTSFAKRVQTLIGHAAGRVSMLETRRAFEAGTSADDFAAMVAAREPVGAALHTQKAEAVKAAAMDAAVTVGAIQLKLEQAGWDRAQVATYPSSQDRDYKAKRAYYSLVSSLTDKVKEDYRMERKGEPCIVKMSDKGIDRFIRQSEQGAALQYDAFICKLVKKCGPTVVDASIKGDHIWSYSFLTVTLEDGTVETWKTQQIINTSIHGLRFPQWPSRKVK